MGDYFDGDTSRRRFGGHDHNCGYKPNQLAIKQAKAMDDTAVFEGLGFSRDNTRMECLRRPCCGFCIHRDGGDDQGIGDCPHKELHPLDRASVLGFTHCPSFQLGNKGADAWCVGCDYDCKFKG